jgi:hypothetical protein
MLRFTGRSDFSFQMSGILFIMLKEVSLEFEPISYFYLIKVKISFLIS